MKKIIYGAQAIALGTYRAIKELFPKQNIECFLVTEMGNNPSVLNCIPVYTLSDFVSGMSDDEKENIEVLIATPENVMEAIERNLDEAGLFYHVCMDSLRWAKLQELAFVKSGRFMPLAAYPVVGVKAVLYDGSYHPVDSSEMAFKMATIQAFKKGFMEAQPILLEPIVSLKVTVPDSYTGDVMGDLNKRRGRVLGMTPVAGGKQIVEADVPMMSLFGYCTDLRSMTGGRGVYEYEFARYEQAPSDVQEKEVAARAAKVAEGNEE